MTRNPRRGQLRIAGVVRAMNKARKELSAGIPPQEAQHFRAWVRHTIATVEEICRRNGLAPEDLPAPTRRAYHFLQGIDLDALPVSARGNPPARKQLRVRRLVTACTGFQRELSSLAEGPDDRPGEASLIERIAATAEKVEQACADLDARPADLPAPSRRAYQWLKFLSEPENLRVHLDALKTAAKAGQKVVCSKKLSALKRKLPVQVTFFHLPYLYRSHVASGVLEISASEGLISAPASVIESLICAAYNGSKGADLAKLKRFAQGEDFGEIITSLELAGSDPTPVTRGRHFDLEKVFWRVNQAYFKGKLEVPRLTWNDTITHRKLGHYHFRSDTVMISITLDHPGVPTEVIDFVMYHELLHKKHGVRVVNGRRYAHTAQFRQEERRFSEYDSVQQFLQKMDAHLSL